MLAPNVGTGQLAVDVTVPPHKPTLPPDLVSGGKAHWGLYKICVSEAGAVSDVSTVKSANPEGRADLDDRWITAIKTWRYRPYQVNGAAVPFCYTIRLQLGQENSAPPGTVMVAPNIGAGLLLTDVTQPPHKPTLPPYLNQAGNVLWGLYKICVSDTGQVKGLKVIKSDDTPELDRRWAGAIKNWRYKPYTVDGKPVPFCYTLRLQVAAS